VVTDVKFALNGECRGVFMDLSDLQRLIDGIARASVLCLGDVMIDRFVYGEVDRISPEGPIPVLSHSHQVVMLGAAGNVARNVAALGARATLIGVVGGDPSAAECARLVADEPGMAGALVSEAARRTTLKTRFVAGGQQLLRVDEEDTRPVTAATCAALEAQIMATADAGVLMISDYAKGVVTPEVIAACLGAAQARVIPVIVDPKGRSFAKYGAVDLIKPNARELSLVVDLPVGSDDEVERALAKALDGCLAKAILVTRSAKGMSLAVRGQPVRHFKAAQRAVFDVSGAGDTCLAALGCALGAGHGLVEAAELALLASSLVVGKPGTAVVTPAELIEGELSAHLTPMEAKITSLDAALAMVERWRQSGLRIGFTNGCFDILHRGHVTYLTHARAHCDRLIVGLNTDASVKRLKGESRPVNGLESRALVLAGLAAVDLVAPFDDDTPLALIEAIRPDVLLKGADYTEDQVVGAELVRAHGGEVKLVPLVDGYSTTAAIRRMAGAA
jgi:D-beta-D-heptose 7-phosphate kinase/D-beta-D-heptose 1-phosphate adenosyltransferase